MNIEQVGELIEKTVVLLGQVNTTCLYERRVNFKSVGTAKQVIKDHAEDFDNTKLLGRDMYDVLDKKAKNRKRARDLARDIRPAQKSRPFREGPSGRGSHPRESESPRKFWRRDQSSDRGRSGGGLGGSQSKQGQRGRYVFLRTVIGSESCSLSESESRDGSQQPPLSCKRPKISGNRTKTNAFWGQNCKFSDKLGENYIRQSNSVIHQGSKNRIHGNPLSECSEVTKPRGERKRGIESGNSRNVDKTSSGGCRSKACKQKRPVSEFFICSAEKRRRTETNLQPERPKQVRGIQSLQNGRVSSSKNHPKTKRLHVQGRSERRIFLCTNKPRSEENSSDLYGRGRPYISKVYHLAWHAVHWSSPKLWNP